MTSNGYREGLGIARLLMVLSSVSPLFILWAIRGTSLIPNFYFLVFCGVMVLVPNTFLWARISIAQKNREMRELTVGCADDHREHLLVYLFAMLLPFYADNLGSWRAFSAAIAALGFVIFLFWHLNLHYMNLLFAIRGYRVFTIHPILDGNPLGGKTSLVLITKRVSVSLNERIMAFRISDTVFFEAEQ